MAKKRIRRSLEEHRRKLYFLWIVILFFLCLVTATIIVVGLERMPKNRALSEEVDYSQLSFEGYKLGDEVPLEVRRNDIVDLDYEYTWEGVSISVDKENRIDRLAFFTTDSSDNSSKGINDVVIEYRGYPVKQLADFATYFGMTNVTNFGHYKYLTYSDEKYGVDITLMDGEIYNIELYKK
ncbi:hypothetical protein IK110_00150 [Candidatus Saccharibacteria bacterium]|nr:hypothetical protein [Candidatus Saccharibacteria bacterium]